MTPKDSFEEIFGSKERVMVIFAHPDDAELYCGGTIARLTGSGKRVMSIKMTSGDRGSRQEKITQEELKRIRETEDKKSMEVLGIKKEDNIYLGITDGAVENNEETIGKLVKLIRNFKPNLIITHNPEDVIIRFDKNTNWINHRDHRNTGITAIDAVYPYSRDLLFFPEHFKEGGVTSHKVSEFLLVDYYSHPDVVYLDVTNYIPTRVKAHASHKSQYTLEQAQSSANFLTKDENGKNYERFRYVIAD